MRKTLMLTKFTACNKTLSAVGLLKYLSHEKFLIFMQICKWNFQKFPWKFRKSGRYAECGSMWRMAGSLSNRLGEQQRAKCLGRTIEQQRHPAPHLSVPRSLPYTSVQTRTSVPPAPRRKLRNAERNCWRRRWLWSWRSEEEDWQSGRPPPVETKWVQVGEKRSTSFLPWKRKWAFRRRSVRRVACFEISLPSAFPLRTKGAGLLTHILLRESPPRWKHWRWWSSALKISTKLVCSNISYVGFGK